MPRLPGLIVLGTTAALCVSPAYAGSVTATLSATYFDICESCSSPDFGGGGGTPIVTLGSSLGPNGLPVATSPYGVSDVDATTHEITWWSPALNAAVVQTGTGTISLPYSSNMYAPNSTGSNDGSYFETAVFKGNFSLSAPATVEFSLGSDDDSFIYVDGILIGQNPGIHGVTTVDFTSGTLPQGSNSIEVFYADRERTGAALSLGLVSSNVTITAAVPEPTSMALLGGGLIALSRIQRRKRPR